MKLTGRSFRTRWWHTFGICSTRKCFHVVDLARLTLGFVLSFRSVHTLPAMRRSRRAPCCGQVWGLQKVAAKTTEVFRWRDCTSPLPSNVSVHIYLCCHHVDLLEATHSQGPLPCQELVRSLLQCTKVIWHAPSIVNGMQYQYECSRRISYFFGLDFIFLSFYGSELNSSQKSHGITSSYF